MLLAIDVGNTNVKFALVEGIEIRTRWRVATDARRTADQYAVWLTQLLELEGYQRSDVSEVVISTVVPRALHNLQLLAEKYFGVDAMVAGRAPLEWGIALDVPQPSSVGASCSQGRSDHDQLCHSNHVRSHCCKRRLQGRDHCAGPQSFAGCACFSCCEIATYRHRGTHR